MAHLLSRVKRAIIKEGEFDSNIDEEAIFGSLITVPNGALLKQLAVWACLPKAKNSCVELSHSQTDEDYLDDTQEQLAPHKTNPQRKEFSSFSMESINSRRRLHSKLGSPKQPAPPSGINGMPATTAALIPTSGTVSTQPPP